MPNKRKVAILGATGAVGQRYIQLLQGHPWFKIEVLAASERSAGKKYKDACNWLMESNLPKEIAEMPVVNADVASVEKAGDVDLVFSSMPGDLAGSVESEFAAMYPVFSKASAHRMEKDVPLIIPEINPDHAELIKFQQQLRGWKGFISTDPNCSTIQMAITLKPLMQFGFKTGCSYHDGVVRLLGCQPQAIGAGAGHIDGEALRLRDRASARRPGAPRLRRPAHAPAQSHTCELKTPSATFSNRPQLPERTLSMCVRPARAKEPK